MEIFKASTNDIPLILEVAEATWKQTYTGIISDEQIDYMYERMYTADALKEQMSSGITFLVCKENEHPAGFVAYEYRFEVPANPEGRMIKVIFVPKLYIKPEFQRKGYGKKLLAEIEKTGVENDCHFMELNVNRGNPSRGFYERLGFFMHQPIDIPYGPFTLNDLVMRKSIQFITP